MADDDINELSASQSWLQRLPRLDLINGTADDLQSALADLTGETQKEWDEEW